MIMKILNKIKNFIIRRFYFYSTKSRIFLGMITVSMFSNLAIGSLFYITANRKIEGYFREIDRENLNIYNRIFDIKMNDFITEMQVIFLDTDFTSALRTPYDSFFDVGEGGRRFDNTDSSFLAHRFTELSIKEFPTLGMYVFDTFGRVFIRPTNMKYNEIYEDYLNRGPDRGSLWYTYTMEQNGREAFFGFDVLVPENKSCISVSKALYDISDRKFVGLLVITMSKEIFTAMLSGVDTKYRSNTFMISDGKEAEEILLTKESTEHAGDIIEQYIDASKKGPLLNNNKYWFVRIQNNITGWYFINGIRKSEINPISVYMLLSITIILIVIFLLCLVISNMIGRKIYKPIEYISKIISNAGLKVLPSPDFLDNSEMGKISKALIVSINDNHELNERLFNTKLKEKEVELAILQSQINPHFLYNTMESLYSLAMLHDVHDIAQMVADLSDIFKITLNKGKEFIKLSEEIEYIKKYMAIQNIRFEQRFALKVEIDEILYDYYMLKFLLQPLVENAVYHGLEPKIGKGEVIIRARNNQGFMELSIIDDGIGIDNINSITRGYGIQNVRKRIQLFYGDEYDISFASERGKGAVLGLKIPVLPEEEYIRRFKIMA
jgi:two-component system sensor histidine kinase YesM